MKELLKKSIALVLTALMLLSCISAAFAAEGERYTLTFVYTDADGKTHTTSQSLAQGAPIPENSYKPESEVSQTFSGWFADEDYTQTAPAEMPAEDLTLYAKMEWIDYAVYYVLDGEDFAEQHYHYGDTIAFPELVAEKGYAFSGWSDSEGKIYTQEDVVVRQMHLYGSLTHTQYQLHYTVNGTHYDSQTYHYEDVIDYLVYPEQTGYTFSGWFADENGTVEAPATMPDADLTVYGTQTHDFYSISYWVNGVDTGVKQTDYHYGDTVRPITSYDNVEGMSFSGWFTDPELEDPVPETMPAENLILYGKQTPKEYVLTYWLDGYYHTTKTYKFNEEITYLAHTEKEGYTFSGWLLKNDEKAPLRMPAHDVDVYGTYKEIASSRFEGSAYENIIVGDFVTVVFSLDAPYLNALHVTDILFDSDVLRPDSMQVLCEQGEIRTDLASRTADITLAENTDLDGDILQLTFEVYKNAKVGVQEVTLLAETTSDMGAGSVKIPVHVTPAKVFVICAEHNYEGGRIVAQNNGTHLLYCANECGVYESIRCAGGTATCQQKAVCSVCEAEYGRREDHQFTGATRPNDNGTHSYACAFGCGEYGNAVNCTYGVALKNDGKDTHKLTCEYCGYSTDENCYGGTFTCLAVGVCERCKAEYGEPLAHSYTGAVKNNHNATHDYLCVNGCNAYGGSTQCAFTYENKSAGIHVKTCSECGYTVDEYCSDGKATCLAPAECLYCKTAYGNVLKHDYSGNGKDNGDGTHSLQCVNGCEQFGAPQPHTAGAYTPDGDGTHTAVCTNCPAVFEGNCEGGTATCIALAVCSVCAGEYGTKPDHSYTGNFAPNGDDTHSRLCVNGCEKTGGEKTNCTYGEWVGDGVSKHTKTCTVCGGTKSEDCTGGTATCTQKAVCDVCKASYGEFLPHTYPEGETGMPQSKQNGTHTRYCTACKQDVVLDCTYEYTPNYNGTHFAKCSACNYTLAKEECFGGKATCEQQAVCQGCNEKYGERLAHSYTGAAKYNEDNATHCLQCVNGCEQYGSEKIACTPDGFVSNGNGTHSAQCTQCAGTLTQDCSGGTSTCEQRAVCAVCKQPYGTDGHQFTLVKYDETHHWWACTGCDALTQKAEHQFSEWTTQSEASLTQAGERWRFCYQCGVTFTEVIPREVQYGDVNADGTVAVSDARTALRVSVGLETLSEAAYILADVNKDGKVEVSDARLILRASVGLENAAEWGTIGIDNNGNVIK